MRAAPRKDNALRRHRDTAETKVAELETAAERRARPVTACGACGDLPAQWCLDCAACKAGCFGGHNGNPCTHPNAPWSRASTPSGRLPRRPTNRFHRTPKDPTP